MAQDHTYFKLSKGDDWDDWLGLLQGILDRKEAWELADPDGTDEDIPTDIIEDAITMRKLRKWACSVIAGSIDRTMMPILREMTETAYADPRERLRFLRKRLSRDTMSNLMTLRSEFNNLRHEEGRPITELRDKITSLVRRLRAMDCAIEEYEQAAVFISALPSPFDLLRVQLLTQIGVQKADYTLSYVFQNALDFETFLKKKEADSGTGLAYMTPGNPAHGKWCRHCKMNNHSTADCGHLRRKGTEGPPTARNWCTHCKRSGHNLSECRSKDKKRQKPSITCYNCGESGHIKRQCPNKGNQSNGIAYVATAPSVPVPTYVLDSGCDKHIATDKRFMATLIMCDGSLGGIGGKIPVTAKGTLRGFPGDALLAPEAPENLVSIRQLTSNGWRATFEGNSATLEDGEGHMIKGIITNALYRVQGTAYAVTETDGATDMYMWHCRLGHPNDKALLDTCEGFINTTKWPETLPMCEACAKAKLHKAPVNHSATHAEEDAKLGKGERLDVDLFGPVPGGNNAARQYILQAVDRNSRMKFSRVLASKGMATTTMAALLDKELTPYGRVCLRIHADRGGEFTGREWQNMCRERGIRYTYCSTDTPAHNGLAERAHRTTVEMARTLLTAANLPDQFFTEALMYATWLCNALPTVGRPDSMTPYEAWTGEKPRYNDLRVFGSTVHFLTPGGKYGKTHSSKGIYLGPAFDTTGGAARIYNLETKRIIVTRDIKVIEPGTAIATTTTAAPASTTLVQIEATPTATPDSQGMGTDSEDEGIVLEGRQRAHQHHDDQHQQTAADCTPAATAKARRKARLHDNLAIDMVGWAPQDLPQLPDATPATANDGMTNLGTALLATANEPTTYYQAISREDSDQWTNSMCDELRSLHDQNVFDIIPRNPDMRSVDAKWVFTLKTDENNVPVRYKSRVVARGFSQIEGIDYDATSAPVISKEAVRTFFAVAVQRGWNIQQFDVNTAYLYADIDKTIYIEPPPGYLDLWGANLTDQQRNMLRDGTAILRLNKALYGLKQSGRRWFETLRDYLRDEFGILPTANEPCLFVGPDMMLVIYVDDGAIATPTKDITHAKLDAIARQYDIKRLGHPRHFIGWTVQRDPHGNVMLHQRGYIKKLDDTYGNGGRPKTTPMTAGAALPDDGPPANATLYREIIGSLLFAATGTRPDIATAVSILSRHMEMPTKAHLAAARTIINYLAATSSLGLLYRRDGELNIETYCDASFAPDEFNRKSRTGYVIMVSGAPVAWRSTLQKVIAHSTAEAEYIAMSDAVREAVYIQHLLQAMGYSANIEQPITVYEDNQVAKRMAEEIATKRSKHIDIKYHHVRELAANGIIKIVDCRTADMLADTFTKPLPKDRFCMLRDRLMSKGEC